MIYYSPRLQHDPDSFLWTYFKAQDGFRRTSPFEDSQYLNPALAQPATDPADYRSASKKPKDLLERLSGIIDTEDPRYEKLKEESLSHWEQGVEKASEGINAQVDQFYALQHSVFSKIQQAADRRQHYCPKLVDSNSTQELEDFASAPWVFQQLPGIQSNLTEESLHNLNTKLRQMDSLSLWGEPIERMNGGPEFIDKLNQTLLSDQASTALRAEAMTALFALASISANQDLILAALDTLIRAQSCSATTTPRHQKTEEAFKVAQPHLSHFLKSILSWVSAAPYYHALQNQGFSRVFGIASVFATQGLSELNTSLTSDGTYLYLAIGAEKRACLYKIGSGEGETIPGKVYLQSKLDREGELTWVHCQDKLYLRYQIGKLGELHIFDPLTLNKTGEAKLFLSDLQGILQNENMNRSYPLLVDPSDGTLCIVACELEKRSRQVRPENAEAISQLNKQKGENQGKSSGKAAQKAEELRKMESKRPHRKHKNADSGAPPVNPQTMETTDFANYSVLQFWVHKFDTTGKLKVTQADTSIEATKTEAELRKDPIVDEMFLTFSGYFEAADCARSLRYNGYDIEQAANWLVAEKEKPDSLMYKRVSSSLICECQVTPDNQLKPGSLLSKSAIVPGRWTLNKNQVTYQSPNPEAGQALVFSLDEADIKESKIEGQVRGAVLKTLENGSMATSPQYYFIENAWHQLTTKQLIERLGEAQKQGNEIFEIRSEESMYEHSNLQNSCIKTIAAKYSVDDHASPYRFSDAEMLIERFGSSNEQFSAKGNGYLTFCHRQQRFYSFNLNDPDRLVSSAPDLCATKSSMITEIGPSQNLGDFVGQVLLVMRDANKARFRLPWRWNNWVFTYQQVLSSMQKPLSISQNNPIFRGMDMPLIDFEVERNKGAIKRIKKRLTLTKENMIVELLEQASISNQMTADQIVQFKSKLEKKQKQRKQQPTNNAQPNPKVMKNWKGFDMLPGTDGQTMYCGRWLGTDLIPHSDGRCGPSNGPQCPDCQKVAPRLSSPSRDYSQGMPGSMFLRPNAQFEAKKLPKITEVEDKYLPTENICVSIELAKQYTFCVTGNVRSLETLLSLLQNSNKDLETSIFDMLLQWTTHASYIAMKQAPQLVNKLYEVCLANLTNETTAVRAKKILTTGWHLFATDAFKQLEILIKLLSPETVNLPESAQLLFSRFCHQASFFDSEILNLRSVTNHFFILKNLQLAQGLIDVVAPNNFKGILAPASDRSLFKNVHMQRAQYSLTEVPIDIIDLMRINGNPCLPAGISFTEQEITPYSFTVPRHFAFGQNFKELRPADLEAFLGVQIELKPADEKDDKLDELIAQQKQKLNVLQTKFIETIKQRLASGCQHSASILSFFFNCAAGQALSPEAFSEEMCEAFTQVVEIALLHPHNDMLTLLVNTIARSSGSTWTPYLAQRCLQKLLQLIGIVQKDTCKIDESIVEGIDATQEFIFETPHPYPKTDKRLSRDYKVPGAIGYIVELDKRSSIDSTGDLLYLRTSDVNTVLGQNVGTNFKIDKIHPHSLIYILQGKQLEIDFRIVNPRKNYNGGGRGGRGGGLFSSSGNGSRSNDEYQRRWGVSLSVRPIFGGSQVIEGDITRASIINNLVQATCKLAREFAEAKFIRSEPEYLLTKVVAQNSSQPVNKVLNWHLLKGGIKIPELDGISDIETILNKGLQIYKPGKKKPYFQRLPQVDRLFDPGNPFQSLPQPYFRPEPVVVPPANSKRFEPEQQVWSEETRSLLESQTLRQTIRKMRIQVPYAQVIQGLKMRPKFKKHWDKWEEVERLLVTAMLYHSGSVSDAYKYCELSDEMLRVTRQPANEDETSYLIEEFSVIGRHVNVVLVWMSKRLQGQSDFQFLIEDTLRDAQAIIDERLALMAAHEAEVARQEQELALMRAAEQETIDYLAALSHHAEQSKKPTLSTSQMVKPAKTKTKTAGKKRTNIIKLTDKYKPVKKPPTDKKKIEESKQEDMPEDLAKPAPSPPKPKYVDLPPNELINIKSKILTKTYQSFVDQYQTDDDLSKLMTISLFFDLDLDVNDQQETLTAVFRKLKQRIKPILDLNTDEPQGQVLPCVVNIEELKLGSPAEEVALDVAERLQLLLEIKPSYNYLAEVTRLSSQKRPKLSAIAEQDEDILSQLSGHVPQLGQTQEDDFLDDDMMEDLPPLTANRSLSLPTAVQSGIARLAEPQTMAGQQIARSRTRKQSAEYANFIDNYRKWRLWSKRSQDEDEDLLSPNGSPLFGVVQFAKMSRVEDTSLLRQMMKEQCYKAAFRLSGLQYQEKLFSQLHDTTFRKYLWGTKAKTLHRSVLTNIETCGESMTRQLNAVTRQIVQQLMGSFCDQYKHFFSKSPRSGSTAKQTQDQQPTSAKLLSLMKRQFLTLNDIRILLTNVYTKEYVLESLRADKLISTRNTLGVDQIKKFLKTLMSVLVKVQVHQGTLNTHVAQVAKLVLRLFIRQSETVKTETQRILQEMLLDIVVSQLASCSTMMQESADTQDKQQVSVGKNFNPGKTMQSSVTQILKMLSEVLRISSQKSEAEGFLQPGSPKVVSCIRLLTQLITCESQTPAVLRQAIKCAKLLNFQISQQVDQSFSNALLKAIGLKIRSYQPESKKNKNDKYCVMAHVNIVQDEDFVFLVTALYQWEQKYPVYDSNLHKAVSEIETPSQDAVKEEAKVALPEEEKDWQTDSERSGDERPQPSAIAAQLLQEADQLELLRSQDELQEMRRILEQLNADGEGRGDQLGIDRFLEAEILRQPPGVEGVNPFSARLLKPSASAAPMRLATGNEVSSRIAALPNTLRIQHLANVMDEVKKRWEAPKSSDPALSKENKLKERNHQIQLSLVLQEAIQLASVLHQRNSAPIKRVLTFEQACELTQLLKDAYAGKLSPVALNPFTSEADAAKEVVCVSKPLKDLFPITSDCVKLLGPPLSRQAQDHQAILAQIRVAPKRFNASIIRAAHSAHFEKDISRFTESKSATKNSKSMITIIHSRSKKIQLGRSTSNMISELVTFVRSLSETALSNVLNQCLQDYLSVDSRVNRDLLFGIVATVGGWNSQIATGSPVEININETWYRGSVVDAGLGKRNMIVILEDDKLTLHKVPTQNVRSYQAPLSVQPDTTLLLKAVIKAGKDDKFLLSLFLRACTQISLQVDPGHSEFKSFAQMLCQIAKTTDCSEEDKSITQWDKALMHSWELLIDAQESNHQVVFLASQPQQLPKLKSQAEANYQVEFIQNNDYVQPVNSYLQGLPEAMTQSNKHQCRLKLLHAWEKNVIPGMLAYCQGHLQPWEFEYFFEQIRHQLRQGQASEAIQSAMTILENKVPSTISIPDENHDWSTKIVEECIVGDWYLAKITKQRTVSSTSNSQESHFSLTIAKLQQLQIKEILVQIKHVEARLNAVLAEYIDYDTMQAHLIWVPIQCLTSLQVPLPTRAVVSSQVLGPQFEQKLSKVAGNYARLALQQIVKRQGSLPCVDLKFEDVVVWTVQEEFASEPVTGWMKHLPQAISLKLPRENLKPQQIQDPQAKKPTLGQILNEQIDLLNRETLKQSLNQDESALTVIQQLLASSTDLQNQMIDWCSTAWFKMSQAISSNKKVIDICDEYQRQALGAGLNLLPLHELIPGGGENAIGTMLMFSKNGVQLVPCSKVQFYSDPGMVNLIHQITAGNELTTQLPPIVLQSSKVWVYYNPGTTALMSLEEKSQLGNRKSSLQLALVSIPKEWQIACWLTETLTTISLQRRATHAESRETFKQLISSILVFYEDSRAPNLLKSVILRLLTRLMFKQRCALSSDSSTTTATHFEKTNISTEFLQNLLTDVSIQMEATNNLHGAFVQDAIEFIMSFVIPVGRTDAEAIRRTEAEISTRIPLPDWLREPIKLSYYLHYFRGELSELPSNEHPQPDVNSFDRDFAERIIVIPLVALPQDFSREWVLTRVRETLVAHHLQILDPEEDTRVIDNHLVIVTDGANPLRPEEAPACKDSDQETEEVAEVKVAIPSLETYNCAICTLENAISAEYCAICQSPRGPLEPLLEAWRKQHEPPENPNKASKPAVDLHRKALVHTLKRLISREQEKTLAEMPVPLEETKEVAPDQDKSESEPDREAEIDLENLPQDLRRRLEVLGIDTCILDEGGREVQDMIAIMQQSAIEEIRNKQNSKKAEKAKRRAERDALKAQADKARKEQFMKSKGAQFCRLSVVCGQEALDDPVIRDVLQSALRERVCTGDSFSEHMLKVIAEIHNNWQQTKEIPLPTDELLQDFEITSETMSTISCDDLVERLHTLMIADSFLLFKFMHSQGYDLWLTQAACVVKRPPVKSVMLLEKMRHLVEQDLCQESKVVERLKPSQLRLRCLLPSMRDKGSLGYWDEAFVPNVYPELYEQISQAQMRQMWSILQQFNKYYAPVIPFINQTQQANYSLSDKSVLPLNFASYISQTRDLCFNCVKSDMRHLILEKTTQAREQPPRLQFERLRLAGQHENNSSPGQMTAEKSKETKDDEQRFMFAVAHDQVREMDLGLLRPEKPRGAEPHIAFQIVFKNEHVVGDGGPYRQFFADISKELQPSRLERGTQQRLLDLLAPCANQLENQKVGKDRFVLHSQANGQEKLSYFEFFGILMGVCIRTGANLMLDLPQLFWRQLVGQKPTLDNFYEIEVKLTTNLRDLCSMSQAEFESEERFWKTFLSDGTPIDLKPNGSTTLVKFNEVEQYVRAVIDSRLRESRPQYDAIRRGISKVIPCSLFNIVTSKELEIWICGKSTTDIDLLRRHTKYSGAYSETHPVIQNFWTMLRQLTDADCQRFIKFCWGQERIPANDQAFRALNVRFMIKQCVNKKVSQDKLMPKADTCFFNFELPEYSSLEIMRAKILQAITFDCVSMNAEEGQPGASGLDNHGPGLFGQEE